jgi:hypothetical protein
MVRRPGSDGLTCLGGESLPVNVQAVLENRIGRLS